MNQISDSEKEKIRKEVNEMLGKFSKAFLKIKLKENLESYQLSGFRKEGIGQTAEKEFRDAMFANAPTVEGNNIVAEKKSW